MFVFGFAFACSKFSGSGDGDQPADGGTPATNDPRDASTDASSTSPIDSGTSLATPELVLGAIEGLRTLSVTADGNALYVGGTKVQRIMLPFSGASTPEDVLTNNAVRSVFAVDARSFAYVYDKGVGEVGLGANDMNVDIGAGNDVIVGQTRIIASVGSTVESWSFNFNDQFDFQAGGTTLGVASDGVHACWVNEAGMLTLTPTLTSQSDSSVIPSDVTSSTSVAIDDSNIYYTSPTEIWRVPKDASSDPTPVAVGLLDPVSLFLDGEMLYWIEADSGVLKRVSPNATESPPQILAQGTPLPDATYTRLVGVDDTYVYWAQPADGVVNRLKK